MSNNIDSLSQKLSGALRIGAVLGLAALFSLVTTGAGAVGVAENVFLEASKYTVKVRARIETAFIEDEVGVNLGAGFLIDAERGWILTNAHVVGWSPATVSVAFQKTAFVDARKLYVDPFLDMAVLEIDVGDQDLTTAPLECNENPSVGHPVGAFGHPWERDFTGTRGIVSGVTTDSNGTFIGMDAAINPGNSGGPLISLNTGQVFGINVANIDEEDDQNTNFAVPMMYVCRIIEILKSGGDPSPPQLPVMFQSSLRDREALIVARTYLAKELLELRPGDEIVGVPGGDGITNETQLIHALRGHLDEVHLDVTRDGEAVSITGRLEAETLITKRTAVLVSGLLLSPSTLRDAVVLGVDNGLMVHSIELGSVGHDLEFDDWDVLTTVDGKPYDDPNRLFAYLKEAQESERSVTVEILRFSENIAIFDYLQRELLVEDLELISGQ